jgi:hypothetical protein
LDNGIGGVVCPIIEVKDCFPCIAASGKNDEIREYYYDAEKNGDCSF